MQNTQSRKPQPPGEQLPFMLGYSVRPAGRSGKDVWSKIGTAWSHADGQGYDVQMDALPIDGKLVLRVISAAEQPDNEVLKQRGA